MKSGFTNKEQLILRDYIVGELGVDCANIEAVGFDETMSQIMTLQEVINKP